jgi:hypothetical protein
MLETSIAPRSPGCGKECTGGELPSDENKKHDCPRHVSNHFQGMFLAIFQSPLSFTCDPGERHGVKHKQAQQRTEIHHNNVPVTTANTGLAPQKLSQGRIMNSEK